MRAVVTGGLGFIGSHLSEWLVGHGWDVLIVDDRRTAVVDSVPGARHYDGPIEAYIGSRPADVIFHLASPVGPLGVIGWRGRLARAVIDDAATVARWAGYADAVLVDVSTSEVYGSGHADREDDVCTFHPDTSARKEYAVAKLAAETMLRNSPVDVRIVRPFNVAGPRQRADGGFVLPRFIAQAQRREPLTVYLPGTQRRAFTHVRDIVEGLVLAATVGRAAEVYNLGNPANECSIIHLAGEVNAALGSDAGYELVDPRDLHGSHFAEAPDKIPDPSKAMRDLGWHPRRDRAQCIADAIGVPA